MGFNGRLEPYRPTVSSPYRNVWFEPEDDEFVATQRLFGAFDRSRTTVSDQERSSEPQQAVDLEDEGAIHVGKRGRACIALIVVPTSPSAAAGGDTETCDKPVPSVAETSQDCRIGAIGAAPFTSRSEQSNGFLRDSIAA